MPRLCAPLVLVALAGCAPDFTTLRTPSGDLCADMAVLPVGAEIERPYRRLGAVATGCPTKPEAEMLAILRRRACSLHADAVIETSRDEAGAGCKVASGTAVVWTGAK